MILDANGNRLTAANLTVPPGTDKAFQLTIECRDGYELSADSGDPEVVIWAKANPGDSFQNIETTPINLSSFAPATRTFYFECRVGAGPFDDPTEIVTINVARP